MLKLLNGLLAVIVGVGGAVAMYWLLNKLVDLLPRRAQERCRPYVFIGPAVAIVGVFLVYPTIRTIILSFFDEEGERFVGVENFVTLLGDSGFQETLLNNLLWILFVPLFAVGIGLAVATLADRLKPRGENVTKSIIFLPMAISFVGAATIWGFIYDLAPAGRPQIGILNAITVGFGGGPVDWLGQRGLNDFLLMVIMVWLQAGFAMVLLSAAIKSVPEDTIEAARIDGANEVQIFWRVIVPQIRTTIAVVFTTVLILVLKVFDIVYALGGGRAGTDVIGTRYFDQAFNARNSGLAAAIVVILLILVIPVMIYNIRRFRAEEAIR